MPVKPQNPRCRKCWYPSRYPKKPGWTRDLAAKIRVKAEAKVNAALVNAEVNAQAGVSERQLVEVKAE